jgi:hypothetical protein
MANSDREKSDHLKGLEAAFEKHTRRFSPFEILGLESERKDEPGHHAELSELVEEGVDIKNPPLGGDDTPTPGYEISTHGCGESTQTWSTPTHGCTTSTRVVVNKSQSIENTTTIPDKIHPPLGGGDTPTPGYEISTPAEILPHLHIKHHVQDIAAAMVIRGQLAEKARRVVGCLNDKRSLNQPSYTVPLGYATLSHAAGLSDRHLRREVLPKLAMLGLVAVAHRSLQGTVYLLQHDAAFLRLIASDDDEIGAELPTPAFMGPSSPPLSLFEATDKTPSWVDQELWGTLSSETIQQLIAKTGSEAQAEEKLNIIIYNESHGPEEKRVRDRRSVLSHYLRVPQADIWPNDSNYETLALRQAREARDRALAEKALAEETLRAQQDTARLRFLASLNASQMAWLKSEAKQRVDNRPEAKFLESRYPLYKAEEESLTLEWMDRVAYGEAVPRLSEHDG